MTSLLLQVIIVLLPLSVNSLGCYVFSEEALLTGFLYGVTTAKLIDRLQTDDPCSTKDCGNGRCVSRVENGNRVAECICDPGYCGENCVPSTVQTGENCPTGLCTVPGSLCVNGICVCDCDEIFVPNTQATANARPVCASGCPNGLSSTFLEIADAGFISDVIGFTPDAGSFDACKNLCLAEPRCRSITTLETGGNFPCRLHAIRRDDPGSFSNNRAGVTYFERLCN